MCLILLFFFFDFNLQVGRKLFTEKFFIELKSRNLFCKEEENGKGRD